MQTKHIETTYTEYATVNELDTQDALMVAHAKEATSKAYAPYSHYHVGVAVLMGDGTIITGANQENVSYPAGICGERVALSAASSMCPHQQVKTMAIFVRSTDFETRKPEGPCGICRQSILETENRFGEPIPIILAAETGSIVRFNSVKDLLPFYFDEAQLKK